MTRQPWRKPRDYANTRPVYSRHCCLCGGQAAFRLRVWIKTLTGWQQTQGYVCTTCSAYWMKEALAAQARGEKVG